MQPFSAAISLAAVQSYEVFLIAVANAAEHINIVRMFSKAPVSPFLEEAFARRVGQYRHLVFCVPFLGFGILLPDGNAAPVQRIFNLLGKAVVWR